MAKITKEQSDLIYSRYLELRYGLGIKKEKVYKIISRELNLGRTTVYDHSRHRELNGTLEAGTNEVEKVNDEDHTVLPEIMEMPTLSYNKVDSKSEYFIITGWEIRVGVDPAFVDCLNQIADYYGAHKYISPVWEKDIEFMPQILKENFDILSSHKKFNENLIFHFSSTHSIAQNPLTGWRGMFPGVSAIIPGLAQEMITEPSFRSTKRLFTTGSIGYLNAEFSSLDTEHLSVDAKKSLYSRWKSLTTRATGKAVSIAQRIVKPTALLIKIVDSRIFFARYVTMHTPGKVYDLDKCFIAGEKGPIKSNPEVMVTGDWHVYHMDKASSDCTIEQIKALNPGKVLLNDFFDGCSVNHHEISSAVKFNDAPSIKEEAEITKKLLDEICSVSKEVVYLHSNHDSFIEKILEEPESTWRFNNNYSMLCRLQSYRLETGKPPIIDLLDLENIDNLVFVHEKEFFINKETTFIHGHNSYRPMGFRGLSKIYGKLVVGHFHAPEIHRGMAFCVGTNAKKDLSYSIGISAVTPCNAIQHPDGSIQLIDIIEGEWIGV